MFAILRTFGPLFPRPVQTEDRCASWRSSGSDKLPEQHWQALLLQPRPMEGLLLAQRPGLLLPCSQRLSSPAACQQRCHWPSRERAPLVTAQAASPFRNGKPEGPGSRPAPPTTPNQAVAADAATGAGTEQRWQQQQAPSVVEQQAALDRLMQRLGRAATYADKVRLCCCVP